MEAAISNRTSENINPRAVFFFHEMQSFGTDQSGIAMTMMSVITARVQYMRSAVFEDSPHMDSANVSLPLLGKYGNCWDQSWS